MGNKRYEVTHSVHYIGGRLVLPDCGVDSIVTLPDGVEPGRWLVEIESDDVASVSSNDNSGPHKVVHVPVGNFAVVGANGLQIGETFKRAGQGEAKAAAEAAAALLNSAASSPLAASTGGDQSLYNHMPDA